MEDKIEAIDNQNICAEMICELATVKVKLGKSFLFIVGVYRIRNNLEEGLHIMSEA